MIRRAKKYTKKRTEKTLRQMVKAKLYRQNHTKKHTHTHSLKKAKEKKIFFLKKEESNPINKEIY